MWNVTIRFLMQIFYVFLTFNKLKIYYKTAEKITLLNINRHYLIDQLLVNRDVH